MVREKAFPKPEFNARNAIAPMPTETIEFRCFRLNLKRTSIFGSDQCQIHSLIEFHLRIGGQSVRHLSVKVRQRNGTDFQSQPLEVGNVIGYDGPLNHEEFRELCRRYYRDVIEACGLGSIIQGGERNLVERVAIRFYRREKLSLPSHLVH
jgi:hypothetical protein